MSARFYVAVGVIHNPMLHIIYCKGDFRKFGVSVAQEYVCMYVWMYVCMCVCLYTCTFVCMYVCVCVLNYVCRYVGMFMCVCMYGGGLLIDDNATSALHTLPHMGFEP